MLFKYPDQATFGRVVPKSKIYEHGRVSSALKKVFVDQVGKIVWKYKLSTDTINLPSRPAAPEIHVFEVVQKVASLKEDVLRCIDAAISFPIFFELLYEDQVQGKVAYKRPSETDSKKWVVDIYFETEWHPADVERTSLPVALDLDSLYDQMLRKQIKITARQDESIRDQVARCGEIRLKEREADKLQTRMNREKQYNRKVEMNGQLRELNNTIKALKK